MSNEIKLYGVIGEEVRAVEVKQQLDAMDQTQPLTVRIHSEGGSVSDGLAMYDAFTAYAGPKRAVIESAAFSIASYIAMAFDQVEITENGYLMIHNPHMEIAGDDAALAHGSAVLSKLKDSMVQAYSQKTGKSTEEVLAIMAAETWINAKEALASGYVSKITPPKQIKAVARLTNMPQGVLQSLFGDGSDAGEQRVEKDKPMSDTKLVAASLGEIKAAFPKAKAEFVLSCLEKQLPMASVMTDALAAMDDELTALRARLAEYETKAAKAMEEEEEVVAMEEEDPAAMEEEEEEIIVAKAKAQRAKAKAGVKPVAKATGSRPSATALWNKEIDAKAAAGMSKVKAASLVNRENPGLREQMLAEVNAR